MCIRIDVERLGTQGTVSQSWLSATSFRSSPIMTQRLGRRRIMHCRGKSMKKINTSGHSTPLLLSTLSGDCMMSTNELQRTLEATGHKLPQDLPRTLLQLTEVLHARPSAIEDLSTLRSADAESDQVHEAAAKLQGTAVMKQVYALLQSLQSTRSIPAQRSQNRSPCLTCKRDKKRVG